jgi:hypothetical protein
MEAADPILNQRPLRLLLVEDSEDDALLPRSELELAVRVIDSLKQRPI